MRRLGPLPHSRSSLRAPPESHWVYSARMPGRFDILGRFPRTEITPVSRSACQSTPAAIANRLRRMLAPFLKGKRDRWQVVIRQLFADDKGMQISGAGSKLSCRVGGEKNNHVVRRGDDPMFTRKFLDNQARIGASCAEGKDQCPARRTVAIRLPRFRFHVAVPTG